MALIYLGGPIDLVNGEQRMAWREKFALELAAREMSSFNPASAFKFLPNNKEHAQILIEINRAALIHSNFAVFLMGKDTPSIGTPMELLMAKQMEIPHVVIWEPDFDSFNSRVQTTKANSSLPAYILGIADHVVHRFDEALTHIVRWERDQGERRSCKVSGPISPIGYPQLI